MGMVKLYGGDQCQSRRDLVREKSFSLDDHLQRGGSSVQVQINAANRGGTDEPDSCVAPAIDHGQRQHRLHAEIP